MLEKYKRGFSLQSWCCLSEVETCNGITKARAVESTESDCLTIQINIDQNCGGRKPGF